MKLLLISRCPPYPLYLGDRLIVFHLAEELARRGYVIDLLAFYDRESDPEETDHYRALFREIKLIREPRRSYFGRLMLPGQMFPRRADEAWSPEMWREIDSRLRSERYDVVQAFGGVHVYEYRPLMRQTPNLIVPYESYSLYLSRTLRQGGLRAGTRLRLLAARRFERAMFAGFDRVVVLTDVDAEALRTLNPTLPLAVIPNGIDLEYFTPHKATPGDSQIILFIGNYEYAPNVDAAIFLAREVFPHVRHALPAAKLLLVGNAPTPQMQSLANGSAGAIEVTGRVADVRPYLESAAVFAAPLRYGAGIKNKVLEAMAMGKAIAGTRLSADGIGLIDGEHILFADGAAGLGGALTRLLQDRAMRERMGYTNRALIEARFTWARVADQYISLYQQIRGEKGK